MCGIVGLFCKSPQLEDRLGEYLGAMLVQMDDRGPDSAGIAVYRDAAPPGSTKLTLYSPDADLDWDLVAAQLGGASVIEVRARHCVLLAEPDAEDWVRTNRPDLRVMSAGRVIEIFKEVGRPSRFVEEFAVGDFTGTH